MKRGGNDHVKQIVDTSQIFRPFLFGHDWNEAKKLAKEGSKEWVELAEKIISQRGIVNRA